MRLRYMRSAAVLAFFAVVFALDGAPAAGAASPKLFVISQAPDAVTLDPHMHSQAETRFCYGGRSERSGSFAVGRLWSGPRTSSSATTER